ncbi:MAG: DUF167 domain-containing protein [Thermoplasmata archaeon]
MGDAVAQLRLWVRPGSATEALAWDPWRERWVVSCRAPPEGGKANRAVLGLMADWLERPRSSVRWVRAGTSPAKVLAVEGITQAEAERRLANRARPV